MKKLIAKIKNNQGNSFVVVIATLSFLTVLTAALLVAVALIYRLKAYDLNAKDNFYYLEQAMDEIYSGVGADSMEKLVQAYDDTLESLVYYDVDNSTTESIKYTTMDNDQANAILKQTFLHKLYSDTTYTDTTKLQNHLIGFLSNPEGGINGDEGVRVEVSNVVKNEGKNLTVYNLTLSRRAKYSTVNALSKQKAKDLNRTDDMNALDTSGETFVQSITTDIVIGPPSMDIKFETNSINTEELYEYSMIADMGIEITNPDGGPAIGDKVSITGNVYAASDFYNKAYNENPGTVNWNGSSSASTLKGEQIQKVNSYSEERLKDCDGVKTKSMYSGIYIDAAEVVFASNRLIVPGTLAAMDCADVTISSISNSTDSWADVWVDGIVLDGFSEKKNLDGDLKGSSLYARAKMYVYDDLEVNANSANVLLNGEYYGYNYASTDNRTYTKDSLSNGTRTFTKNTNKVYKDGKAIEGQAHYNSSAVILNGENTNLDFSMVTNMYIAGQSYIELSKDKKKEKLEDVTYSVTTKTDEGTTITDVTEDLERNSYDYEGQKKDKDGNVVDNYTTTNGKNLTQIQDYRTGEAVSIKSNQLAYIPNTNVQEDEDGNLYVNIPSGYRNLPIYKDVWDDLSKVPVIKTVVSGKSYYFYDFSKAADTAAMNQFIADYASLFDIDTITDASGLTTGEKSDLTKITDYDFFEVEALNVLLDDNDSKIYTNSAITTKVDTTFTIKAKQQDVAALMDAADNLGISEAEKTAAGANATALTSAIQKQYKEAKWMLTNTSLSPEFKAEAQALAEDCITPINHFFNFDLIEKDNSKYISLDCGYGVWISDGDVKIGASECTINKKSTTYDKSYKKGHVRGIVLCKGDVTFDTDVVDFEGLIVSGGKIIINNFTGTKKKMALTCNAEIIKTVLRECDSTRGEVASKNYGYVCDIFRLFESTYKADDEEGDNETQRYKTIATIQFEDIISLQNWIKNVE